MAEREGFEPSDRLHGQRFSRPPRSTTPAPLLIDLKLGGEGGIRTLGTGLPHTRFPVVHLRPLGHLSRPVALLRHAISNSCKEPIRAVGEGPQKNSLNNEPHSSASTPRAHSDPVIQAVGSLTNSPRLPQNPAFGSARSDRPGRRTSPLTRAPAHMAHGSRGNNHLAISRTANPRCDAHVRPQWLRVSACAKGSPWVSLAPIETPRPASRRCERPPLRPALLAKRLLLWRASSSASRIHRVSLASAVT